MRFSLKALTVGAAVVLSAQPVLAADLFMRSSVYDHQVTWRGIYGGIHAGLGSASVSARAPNSGTTDMDGGIFGGHIGYNIQLQRFVVGVEADYDMSGIEKSETFAGVTAKLAMPEVASVRARLGYTMGDAMIYGTLGAAWSNLELSGTAGPVTVKLTDALSGFVIGAGVEYKIMKNLSGRIEALHYDFGDQTFKIGANEIKYSADMTQFRAGLSLHLN